MQCLKYLTVDFNEVTVERYRFSKNSQTQILFYHLFLLQPSPSPAELTAGSHVLSLLLILSLCFRTSELLDIYLTKYKNILHNLVVSVGNISPGLIRYIYHLWLAAALTLAAFQFGLIIVMYRGSQASDCIDRSIQTFCDAGRYC